MYYQDAMSPLRKDATDGGHDKVLRELADIMERERIKKRKPAKSCTFINFV